MHTHFQIIENNIIAYYSFHGVYSTFTSQGGAALELCQALHSGEGHYLYELFHIYFRKQKMCSKVTVQDHVKKKDEVLAKTAELCLRDGFNPSFAAQFFSNAG